MSNKVHWNRRQFVVAGTTAVVGLAAWPYEAVATDSPTAPAFVSVGFVNEISGRTRRAARLTPTFMPADSVLTGDPTFFREGARIRVHGFNVAKQSLSLHVLHPVDELPERVPFYAWASGANGVAFRVPVGAQELVEIVVERRDLRNPEAPVERAVLRFGVNSGRDAYMLNAGTYAVVLGRPGEAKPNWPSISLQEDREGLISMIGDVPFEYLLLTVSNPAA